MWAVFMNLRFELDLAKKEPKSGSGSSSKVPHSYGGLTYPGHAHRTGGATV